MSHVHVAAYDDGFLGIEVFEKLAKVFFPCHSVVEPTQFILRVWSVDGNEIEVFVL